MIKRAQVIEALKKCIDPEIMIDIWTLGLIKELKIKNDKIGIRMVLTSPFCPYASQMVEQIKTTVKAIKGVKDVQVELDLNAKWEPPKEIRSSLGV